MRNTIFEDLFVLELANNHWGNMERGKKIIDDFSRIVRFNNIKAAIKLQFRDVDNFIHKDFKNREDIRYINKLFELTYINDIDIMRQVGFILINAIIYNKCDEDKLKEILKTTPLIQRCKELISINNFNDSLKLAYLELLESIVEKVSREEYGYLFSDFIYGTEGASPTITLSSPNDFASLTMFVWNGEKSGTQFWYVTFVPASTVTYLSSEILMVFDLS